MVTVSIQDLDFHWPLLLLFQCLTFDRGMVLIKDSAIGSDRQKIKLFYSEKSGPTESEILQIIRLLHMNYISQFIKIFQRCVSYHDFLDRWLLLTRELLNQDFLMAKWSLLKFYSRHHTLINLDRMSVSQMTWYVATILSFPRS
jgi:hypothetical protein